MADAWDDAVALVERLIAEKGKDPEDLASGEEEFIKHAAELAADQFAHLTDPILIVLIGLYTADLSKFVGKHYTFNG